MDVFEATTYLSSRNSCVIAFGTVFGCSINDVIPPATAARDSVAIVALCVNPGSRKCT